MQHNTEMKSPVSTFTSVSVLVLLVIWAGVLAAWAIGSLVLSDSELSAFLLLSGLVFGTIAWLLRDRPE